MKPTKKTKTKTTQIHCHLVILNDSKSFDLISFIEILQKKYSFLSYSVVSDNSQFQNKTLPKNVSFFRTIHDVKQKFEDYHSNDDVFIFNVDKDIAIIKNAIDKKTNYESDIDVFYTEQVNKKELLILKNFIFQSINWSYNETIRTSLVNFFKNSYYEAKSYNVVWITINNEQFFSLSEILKLNYFTKIILYVKSLVGIAFYKQTVYYKRKHFIFAESTVYPLVFIIISSVFFFLLPLLSLDASISGDEEKHVEQAEKVFSYFATNGEDTSYMVCPYGPFYAYNITFDVVLHILIDQFNVQNIYEFRHVFNSYSGFFTILFCGLLVAGIAGWRAGVIALILLFISPRFLGHSMNNPKDIPFALGYIFTIYYMYKFLKQLPKISLKYSILIVLGIGFTLNIRIGGLLLIAYLFLFVALHTLNYYKLSILLKSKLKYVGKIIIVLSLISVFGYVLGIIFWPYGLEDPINNPLESLKIMTNFKVSLKQTFEGDVIWSDNVPWYYTIKYMLITIPLIVLMGLAVSLSTFLPLLRKYGWLHVFMLFFTFLFPLIYIIIKESNVYGGWRHMNFIYVIIVAISAISLNYVFYFIQRKYIKYALISLFVITSLRPVIHLFKNHPYYYIYFNPIVGGVNGAYGNYEMDYYYNSLKEGSEWLTKNVIQNLDENSTPIIVATNHAVHTNYYLRKSKNEVTVNYVRFYDRGNYNWDYAVIANSYINPYQQKNGYWPPANTIHEIKVDNAVVGAVIERKDKNDYHGYQAMKEKNYFKAEVHLKKALEANPNNEVARINLAKLYIDQNRLNEANGIVNGTLKIYHNYDKALNLLGIIYLKKREFNNALGVFNRITQVNPKFVNAYHNIGVVLLNQKKNQQALDYFRKALKINSRYKPSYMAIAHILRQAGKEEEAQRYVDAANKL